MPLAIRPTVGGERVHGREELLELQGRPHLAPEPRRCLTGIPEAVGGARLDDDRLAGAGDDRLAVRHEPHLALEDLEALGLVRMDVGGGDEAVRLDADVDEDVLAARLGGGAHDVHGLAGDGVVEDVSAADHAGLLRIVMQQDWQRPKAPVDDVRAQCGEPVGRGAADRTPQRSRVLVRVARQTRSRRSERVSGACRPRRSDAPDRDLLP